MPRPSFVVSSLSTLLAVGALAAGAGGAAASAAAPCQVNGGGEMSEWSMRVTYLKNMRCAEAKRVLTTCASRSKVPGWTLRLDEGKARFSKNGTSKRFVAMLAGGAAQCVEAAEDF